MLAFIISSPTVPFKFTPNKPKMQCYTTVLMAAIAATAAQPAHLPVHPAPVHHAPAHGYDASPKPYAFEYGVSDSYSGANFAQKETSDAKVTTGSYTVALPDGRTQIVNYQADPHGYGGYVADVKYKGVAHPGPAYKPAPHPVPVHHAPVHHAPIKPIHG